MRFRRHQPPTLRVDWRKLGARILRPFRTLAGSRKGEQPPSAQPDRREDSSVAGEHAANVHILERWRRRVSQQPQWLLATAVAVGVFACGYLFAAIMLFPAPFFPRSHAVPRALGLDLAQAQQTLEEARLVVSDTELVSHPAIPPGDVVWQDPPPHVAVPEGTGVALWVSRGPRPIPVPDVTGYQQELAVRLIQAAGLSVARIDTTIAPQERGVVVNTRPPAGQSREPGDGITLFVSVGTPSISVPDLAGLRLDEARQVLEELGLVLGSTRSRRTSVADSGIIIEQNPAAGTLSAPGGVVNVTIVRGERM